MPGAERDIQRKPQQQQQQPIVAQHNATNNSSSVASTAAVTSASVELPSLAPEAHPVRDAANFAITKAKQNKVVQFGLSALAPLYTPVLPIVTPYYTQAEKLASPYIDIADSKVAETMNNLTKTQESLKRKVDELKPTIYKVKDPKQVKAALEQIYQKSSEVFLASVASPVKSSEEFVSSVKTSLHNIWDERLTPYIQSFYDNAKHVYASTAQPQVDNAKNLVAAVKEKLGSAWEYDVTGVLKSKAMPIWQGGLHLTQDIFDKFVPQIKLEQVEGQSSADPAAPTDNVTLESLKQHVRARLVAQAEQKYQIAKNVSVSTYATVKQFSHDKVLPLAKVDPVAVVEARVLATLPQLDTYKKNLDDLQTRLKDLQSSFSEWSVKARDLGVNPLVERVQPLLKSTVSQVESVRKGAVDQVHTRGANLAKALAELQTALADFGNKAKQIPQLQQLQNKVVTSVAHLAQITQRFQNNVAAGSASPAPVTPVVAPVSSN